MDAESYADTIAQFTIPKAAFAAANVPAIERQARAEGVERPRIEADTKNAGGNRIRLTCRLPMVDRITEAITAATALAERKHDAALVADLSIAMAAALEGRDEALNPRHLSMGDTGYLGA
jgi:hypothetical protein